RLLRGHLDRRHVRKNGLLGSPAARTSATDGLRSRPATSAPSVAVSLFAYTASSSRASGFTQTAAMSKNASASPFDMVPLRNAPITPAATPACAAPHAHRACSSP